MPDVARQRRVFMLKKTAVPPPPPRRLLAHLVPQLFDAGAALPVPFQGEEILPGPLNVCRALIGSWRCGVVAGDEKWRESRTKENLLPWMARPALAKVSVQSAILLSVSAEQPLRCAARERLSSLILSRCILTLAPAPLSCSL